MPADPVEPVAQGVAPGLVDLVDLLRVVGRLVHGHDGRDLDRLERPVVEVALELGQGLDDLGVAHEEADPPPGHGEGLGHGVELDRHVRRRTARIDGGS